MLLLFGWKRSWFCSYIFLLGLLRRREFYQSMATCIRATVFFVIHCHSGQSLTNVTCCAPIGLGLSFWSFWIHIDNPMWELQVGFSKSPLTSVAIFVSIPLFLRSPDTSFLWLPNIPRPPPESKVFKPILLSKGNISRKHINRPKRFFFHFCLSGQVITWLYQIGIIQASCLARSKIVHSSSCATSTIANTVSNLPTACQAISWS